MEDVLAQFVVEECIHPALARARVLVAESLPMLCPSPLASNSDTSMAFSPPAQGPRKRALETASVAVTTPTAGGPDTVRQADARICRNRQKGKKCLTGRAHAVFEDDASLCCIPCVAAFGGVGNFNAARAKKLRTL